MIYPNRGFTFVTLFFFLVGLFVNCSWARDAPLDTGSTLNADNFRFNLSWRVPKKDHALAGRAVDLAPRTDTSYYNTRAQRGRDLDCATQMDSTAASARLGRDVEAAYTTTEDLNNAGWILITDDAAEIASDQKRISRYLSGELLDGLSVNLANNVVADWKWAVGEDGVLTKDVCMRCLCFPRHYSINIVTRRTDLEPCKLINNFF